MKKILIIFFSILFMIFSFSSYSFAKNFYPATAINGGGTGALDKIDGSGLSNADVAFVVLENDGTYGNALLIFVLDDDSAAAESSPTVISPDTNAGTKRWELTTIVSPSFQNTPSTSPTVTFLDSDAPGSDKEVGDITVEYVDGIDGSENSDIFIYIWQDGTKTLVLQFDESDDQWETTKNIFIGGNVIVSGIITGLVNTSNTPASLTNFNGSFTISSVGSTSLSLPTAAAGYSVCIRQGQGRTDILSSTPASGDYIVKDGVRGTIATAISSGGAATDKACFTAVDDTDWYMDYTGTWSE